MKEKEEKYSEKKKNGRKKNKPVEAERKEFQRRFFCHRLLNRNSTKVIDKFRLVYRLSNDKCLR